MKITIVTSKIVSLFIDDEDKFIEHFGAALEDPQKRGRAQFSTKVDFEPERFFVTFDLSLVTENGKALNVVYKSEFKTDCEIGEAFEASDFPYVNAPAIAYPYLRAFVSNLTLNSGYSPVMLPSVNFVALKDQIKKT